MNIHRKMYGLFSLIIAIGVLGLNSVYAQNIEWNQKKDESNIQIYTRSIEGSALDEFKGETILNVPLEKIVEKLKAVEEMKSWVPNCKEAKLLSLEGSDQYHYIESSVPFPMKNRDTVFHFKYQTVENGIKIQVEGKPDHIPPKKGVVRMPSASGHWLLIVLEENKTAVTYQLHADPGGSIPSWLANATAVDMPFDTLKNLKKALE